MSGITVNLAGNSGAGVSPYAQPQPQQPTSPISHGDGATRHDGDTAAGATPTTDTAAATPSTPTGEPGAVIDGALNDMADGLITQFQEPEGEDDEL